MDFRNFNPKPAQIIKVAGIVILAAFVLSFAARLLLSGAYYSGRDYPPIGYGNMAHDESAAVSSRSSLGLSVPAGEKVILPPDPSPVPGADAEEYDVTEYRGQIESGNKEKVCGRLLELKSKDYIIFENAKEYDKGCNYTFKVEKNRTDEVLSLINEFNPRELSENTYTIKRQIKDIEDSITILQNQLDSLDKTLENAIAAYDDITRLANQTRDADALAKIIDSKIGIIERLTEKKLSLIERLEYLARARAEQTDRLNYTYFYITVVENKYIDGEQLKDNWRAEVQAFVRDMNRVVQNLSIGLVRFVVLGAQYVLYAFLVLLVVKYGWKAGKRIWKR